MKLYLSSFRLGDEPEKFAQLFGDNKKVAVIANAVDELEGTMRSERVTNEINWLADIGLQATVIDLRSYFGDNTRLAIDLADFAGVWVRGGNSFVLRRAFAQSGFDKWLIAKNQSQQLIDSHFVYGGYSAGVVVLAPELYGIEIVDPLHINPKGYQTETIWTGLGIIDFNFAPHYQSEHPESANIEKTIELWQSQGKPFRALHDGEVIIKEE